MAIAPNLERVASATAAKSAALEAAYDAIEAKGGERPDGVSGLADAIAALPAGDGNPAGDLLDALTIAADESVVYFACDGSAEEQNRVFVFKTTLSTAENYAIYTRGRVVDGEFVADDSDDAVERLKSASVFASSYPASDDYVVYRVTPETSGDVITCINRVETATVDGVYRNVRDAMAMIAIRSGHIRWLANPSYVFNRLRRLVSIDISLSDGSNVTELLNFCEHCTSLQHVRLPDGFASQAKTITAAFSSCLSLKDATLPRGFGANATSITSTFQDCRSLKRIVLPRGFGANATSIAYMFYNAMSIESIQFSAGFGANAANMCFLFCNCHMLQDISLPANFGGVATDVRAMLQNVYSLTDLVLPEGFGAAATTGLDSFLAGVNALRSITGIGSITASITLSASGAYSHDSLVAILGELATVGSATLTLGATNLKKLTDDEKAIATAKGWALA